MHFPSDATQYMKNSYFIKRGLKIMKIKKSSMGEIYDKPVPCPKKGNKLIESWHNWYYPEMALRWLK